jgi:hypothetical protein
VLLGTAGLVCSVQRGYVSLQHACSVAVGLQGHCPCATSPKLLHVGRCSSVMSDGYTGCVYTLSCLCLGNKSEVLVLVIVLSGFGGYSSMSVALAGWQHSISCVRNVVCELFK